MFLFRKQAGWRWRAWRGTVLCAVLCYAFCGAGATRALSIDPTIPGEGGTSIAQSTLAGTLEEAPGFELENPRVTVLSPEIARVTWVTPHLSDSEVGWGKTSSLEATPILQPEPTLVHTVMLSNLAPGCTYYCQAASSTAGGKTAVSRVLRFVTPRLETYTVRTSRPRVLFNQDDMPVIRQRIATTHASAWSKLLSNCDSALSKSTASLASSTSNWHYARALAFAGLFAGDQRYRSKAQEIALTCAAEGTGGSDMDLRYRILGISAVYDWLYPYLSDSVKSQLRRAMSSMCVALESCINEKEYVWGHSDGNQRPIFIAMVAMYGEATEAASKVDELLKNYRYGYLPTWRHFSEDGGSLRGWWYTTWMLPMEVDFLTTLKSATGLDWFEAESWMEALVDWQLMGMRGDDRFCPSGDGLVMSGLNYFDWIYALSIAHQTRSPKAKWLAERIASAVPVWSLYNLYDILWNDPDVVAQPPSGALSRLFQASGHAIMRSSWQPDAVIADFRSASDYTLGHTHLDNNSFTLFHRGGLALDSGIYDSFGSSHHRNYYTRTIAHNTMLIFDPAEEFILYGTRYSNDGGQKWLKPPSDVPYAFPHHIEDVLDPARGFQAGGIAVFEDSSEYTYSLGDAAPSYSPHKLKRFDRHFLWLKGDTGTVKPAVVIFDRVVATSSSFKKTYLLHTQNRPIVSGTLVTATNGGGALFHRTLLPLSPDIQVVGGSGQEYWANGVNYTTTRAAKPEEDAGLYRLEISPSVASAADNFLHVLHPVDAGSCSAPSSSRVAGTGMEGCKVGGWIVLFAVERGGLEGTSYSVPSGALEHLLVGLVPHGTYDVFVDGARAGRAVASPRGLVRLSTMAAGKIQLARAAWGADEGSPDPVPSPAPSPDPEPTAAPEPTPVPDPEPTPAPAPSPGGECPGGSGESGPVEIPPSSVNSPEPVPVGSPVASIPLAPAGTVAPLPLIPKLSHRLQGAEAPWTQVLDNGAEGTSFTGYWTRSEGRNPYNGSATYTRGEGATYTWTGAVPRKGKYKIFMWWSAYETRAPKVPVAVQHAGGISRLKINQRKNAGKWKYLGTFRMDGPFSVSLASLSSRFSVCADAICLVECKK